MDNQQNGLAVQPSPDAASASPRSDATQRDASTLTIVDLLRTSRELSEAIVPLAPRADFRAELYDELLLSARRQYAQRQIVGDFADRPVAQEGVSRRLVLGAAAVGLSSAVSVISVVTAYYLRRRSRKGDRFDDIPEETREAA